MDNLPDEIQQAVDQYVALHFVSKQMEERMRKMKEVILPFMTEHGLTIIPSKEQPGQVHIMTTERSPMTSRYSTYHLDTISSYLSPEVLEKCVVSVVDRDKLDALYKMGEIDEDILSHKTTQTSYSLIVRPRK